MSRIGNKPISIPEKVTVKITDNEVIVTGPKGELKVKQLPKIKVEVKDNQVVVTRSGNDKKARSFHGLMRSLIENHVYGVTKGYEKTLKLVGTGYRVKPKGKDLTLTLGFSHPVDVICLPGITFKLDGNDTIHVQGIDKQLVGQVAANIRSLKPPEPYKGKGVRYKDEVVRRKQGKATVT